MTPAGIEANIRSMYKYRYQEKQAECKVEQNKVMSNHQVLIDFSEKVVRNDLFCFALLTCIFADARIQREIHIGLTMIANKYKPKPVPIRHYEIMN